MSNIAQLELAAIAFGAKYRIEGNGIFLLSYLDAPAYEWKPREDDGDALRLANELELNMFHAAGRAYALPSEGDEEYEVSVAYRDAGGKHAAMRRAILEVAEAMGKDVVAAIE